MKNFAIFPQMLFYGLMTIIFLLIGKLIYDLLTSYKLNKEIGQNKNSAVGISLFGYFIALIIIIMGAIPNIHNTPLEDGIIRFWLHGLLGILLLNMSRLTIYKLILYKFNISNELIKDKNIGTGIVLAGGYIASGLVISASISLSPSYLGLFYYSFGPLLTEVLLSIVFFLIGQITFIIYSLILGWISPYNIQLEIDKANISAGISFSGRLIALGLILFKGIYADGKFINWGDSLTYYIWLSIFAIIAFPLIRIFVDKAMLFGLSLNKEITQRSNISASLIEVVCLNALAVVIIASY